MLKFKYQIKNSQIHLVLIYPLDKRNSIQNYLDFYLKNMRLKMLLI